MLAAAMASVVLLVTLGYHLARASSARGEAERALAECRAAHESAVRLLEEQRLALEELKARLADAESAAREAMKARDAAIARARAARTSMPAEQHACDREALPTATAQWLASLARASR